MIVNLFYYGGVLRRGWINEHQCRSTRTL